MFKRESGNWTEYRKLESIMEVDFHYSEYSPRELSCDSPMSYDSPMETVYINAMRALENAYERGFKWLLLTHGKSTSRPGKTTARSVVRRLMTSKHATPFIIRKECVQHDSVFLAAIRPKHLAKTVEGKPSEKEPIPSEGKESSSGNEVRSS
jgi:hypothetical protein